MWGKRSWHVVPPCKSPLPSSRLPGVFLFVYSCRQLGFAPYSKGKSSSPLAVPKSALRRASHDSMSLGRFRLCVLANAVYNSAGGMCLSRMKIRPRNAESNGGGGSGGHFSKSARSGAPPVISVNVKRQTRVDRKSTRLNSSHLVISYAVFCLKKKK